MDVRICCPKTYMAHPHQLKFRTLLEKLFASPESERIAANVAGFLKKYPLPVEDFPRLEGAYTRTILYRSDNGFEAMAARWSRGAMSSIHGHPDFTFYFVTEGRLEIDNYRKCGNLVEKTDTEILAGSEFFSSTGWSKTFDNNIHQVQASEETLSIHISSDDSTKGEVYSQYQ